MKGNIDVLEPYIEFISSEENEVLMGLFKVIKAANLYHWDIDKYIDRFEHLIMARLKRQEPISRYTEEHLMNDRFASFLADVGMYYIRKNNKRKGLQYMLDSLEFSCINNHTINIVRCCTTIEHLQSELSPDGLQRYAAIRDKIKGSGTLVLL